MSMGLSFIHKYQVFKILIMSEKINFHGLEIKYLGPTNTRGTRIKIISHRFKENIIISYNYSLNCIADMAIDYLQKQGFKIVGQAETKEGYMIITNTFKGLK